MKELRICIRILPMWWGHAEQLWNDVLKKEPLSSVSKTQRSWKSRFMRGDLHFHEAILVSLFSVFFFLVSPLSRTKSMLGIVLGSIGVGLLLSPFHDSRIVIISTIGLLAFSYPSVVVLLIMSVGLPWWFSLLGLISFVRTTLLKRAWIISVGLSLAFFYMLF